MNKIAIRLQKPWKNGSTVHPIGSALRVQDSTAARLIEKGIAISYGFEDHEETLFNHEGSKSAGPRHPASLYDHPNTKLIGNDDERGSFRKFWFGSTEPVSLDSVGFDGPAEFLNATKNFKLGVNTDARLSEYTKASGMSTLIGEDGGYAVPTDFAFPAIMEMERNPLLSMLTRFPVRGSSLKIPRLWDFDRQSYRFSSIDSVDAVGEGAQIGSKKPKFERLTLNPKKHGFLLYATSELLEDSGYVMGQILPDCMTRACILELERQVISGAGGNEMLGILNAPCLVSQSRETASTITYGDIANMWSRLRPKARRNAVWICSNAALPMLLQLHADWQYSSSDFSELVHPNVATPIQNNFGLELLGRPVLVSDFASNLGTAGDLLVCDPSMFAVGKKESAAYSYDGFRIDYSPHVGFVTDEHCWRVVFRADGQPLESRTYQPENGGNTMSSFVQLS